MVKQIILVGSGVMGSALVQGWKDDDEIKIFIIDPNLEGAYASVDDLLGKIKADVTHFIPDAIVFAVKPQMIDSILPEYKKFQREQCVFISIAAGTSIENLKKHLGDKALCVRVMPNLAATVRSSVSGLYTNDSLTAAQKDFVFRLFQCIGMAFWVETQNQIDILTSLSGSGPAYVFRFMEALVASAQQSGFDEITANHIILQTVLGAVKLLEQGGTPSDWRQRVTSSGGTTAAALAVFEKQGLDSIVNDAVEAAYVRAKELSEG